MARGRMRGSHEDHQRSRDRESSGKQGGSTSTQCAVWHGVGSEQKVNGGESDLQSTRQERPKISSASTSAASVALHDNEFVDVDNVDTYRKAMGSLVKEVEVAVDIEHHGKSGIVTVRGRESRTTYLFHIRSLQASAFEAGDRGLKSLLESNEVLKVFLDQRKDTNWLFYGHDVRAHRAYDVQVLYHLKFCGPTTEHLTGSKKMLDKYGEKEIPTDEKLRLESVNEQGRCLFDKTKDQNAWNVWEEGSLRPELKQYCAAGVKYLLNMKDLWGEGMLNYVLDISETRIKFFIDSGPDIPLEWQTKPEFDIPPGLQQELPYEETVEVPSHRYGLVIGSGGRRIKDIEKISGAAVSLNHSTSIATVKGTHKQVASAVGQIRKIIGFGR